jgi:hypothetical protein
MLKVILDAPPPDVYVVLIRRDIQEIHASEERIGWEERLKGNSRELSMFGLAAGSSAAVKYDYWERSRKSENFVEIDYDSLQAHPLYIPANLRGDFRPKQTELSEESAGRPGG